MTEMNDIVKVAVDAYFGKVEKYSVGQSQELVRKALIEANGGSSKLDLRAVRDGKCGELFALVEEILANTVIEGLTEDDFFNAMVDYRNMAEGDENVFVTEDSTLFVVAETADGTQGVRRQRLGDRKETPIPTVFHTVRIYEELNRVLAGRIDFNAMIDRVGKSFRQQILNDIYTLWDNVSATQIGGAQYFPVAGAYNEDTLLDVIAEVEAAAGGKPATIIGTKKAIRNLVPSIQSDGYKDDLYNLGYAGKFYGTPVVVVNQRHQIGGQGMVFDDNVLTIIAGDDKPIKFVYEGDPIVLLGNPLDNADLTQEYFYGNKWGLGLILASENSGIGRYDMTVA